MSRPPTDEEFRGRFAARLSLYLDSLGLTVPQTADLLDVTIDLIYKVRRGTNVLSIERLVLLASEAVPHGKRCNLHWLLTGEGKMCADEMPMTPGALPAPFEKLSPGALSALGSFVRELSLKQTG